MRVIEKMVYQYAELNDKAKEKARDWYRECVAQDWEPDLGDAATCLGFLGFTVDTDTSGRIDIGYSIGYTQSDFANFAGNWKAEDVDMAGLQEYAPVDEKLKAMCVRAMTMLLTWPTSCGYIGREARGGTFVDWADERPDGGSNDELFDSLKGLAADACSWLYDQLRTEYEFRTSEEQLTEGIEANEYEFDEDGKLV